MSPGFPTNTLAQSTAIALVLADIVVLTAIFAAMSMQPIKHSVELVLNPYQPNHRMNVPNVAKAGDADRNSITFPSYVEQQRMSNFLKKFGGFDERMKTQRTLHSFRCCSALGNLFELTFR